MFLKLFDFTFQAFPLAVARPVGGGPVGSGVKSLCVTVYGGLVACILVGILAVG